MVMQGSLLYFKETVECDVESWKIKTIFDNSRSDYLICSLKLFGDNFRGKTRWFIVFQINVSILLDFRYSLEKSRQCTYFYHFAVKMVEVDVNFLFKAR